MLKACIVSIMLFILCGCVQKPFDQSHINEVLTQAPKQRDIASTNMEKPYYKYYLPTDMGKKDSTVLSEVLKKNGYEIIMNFNTSAVVIDTYYKPSNKKEQKESKIMPSVMKVSKPSEEELQKITYQKDGKVETYRGIYVNRNKQYYEYQLTLEKLQNQKVILHMNGCVVDFYAIIPQVEITPAIHAIMRIMKSIAFEAPQIVSDFSLKRAQQSRKENLDFVSSKFANEGYLADLDYREVTSPKE